MRQRASTVYDSKLIENYYHKLTLKLPSDFYQQIVEKENGISLSSEINLQTFNELCNLYKKAIEIKPNEVNAYILLGNLYSNIKNYKDAEMQYREALKINKLDPSLYVLIANTFYMNNEIERSIFSYRAAVNLKPENDEYKLVFIQVLEDFIAEHRKEDIVANF
jgi:tetratricopeptide (TPR) repeat protein